MASNGPDKQEFSDSDRQWFDALSGKAVDPESKAAREGFAMRVALEQRRLEQQRREAAATEADEAAARARLEKLRQRARAEGLFEPSAAAPERAPAPAPPPPTPAPGNVIEFPWWRRQRRTVFALAASVLLGTVVVTQLVQRPDYEAPPQMLGTGSVQKVLAPAPRRAAERLAEQLRQAGLRPGIYQRGKTYIVDITLMAAELAAAAPAFATLGLEPAAGFNRVEFGPA
jgi:hypothetical protein